ncbi:MAG TPA: hypothetical protein DDW30_05005 [Clostridiales bacterium]|nr:hypothetical protein [Clostridiales bacterium]
MAVYIVLYCLIALFGVYTFYRRNCPEKRHVWGIILMTLLFTALVALRHPSMGIDLHYGEAAGYLASYHDIANLSFRDLFALEDWQNYEWGYVVFNKLLSYISTDYQVLLIACAVLSIIPIGVVIALYSKDYDFSMVVYLGLSLGLIVFSALRQAIAVGICSLSYPFIRRKQWAPFLLLVFLAWLFHSSAIVFLVAYPAYHLKLKKWQRLLGLPVLAGIFFGRYQLFNLAMKLLGKTNVPEETGAYRLMLVFWMIYLFCVVLWDKEDELSGGFLNIFYFACICQSFSSVNSIAERLGYYFMVALVIALPNIVTRVQNLKFRMLLKYSICSAFVAFGLYSFYTCYWSQSYPYHFFWENVPATTTAA